jgi:plasmid maintenance system antidote protein VapI
MSLRPTLSSLLNAKADLSGDMALRFEKACGRRHQPRPAA